MPTVAHLTILVLRVVQGTTIAAWRWRCCLRQCARAGTLSMTQVHMTLWCMSRLNSHVPCRPHSSLWWSPGHEFVPGPPCHLCALRHYHRPSRSTGELQSARACSMTMLSPCLGHHQQHLWCSMARVDPATVPRPCQRFKEDTPTHDEAQHVGQGNLALELPLMHRSHDMQ